MNSINSGFVVKKDINDEVSEFKLILIRVSTK